MLSNGNDSHLNGSYLRRQDKSVIVTVCHDDSTDHTCGNTPGRLMRIAYLILTVCVRYIKRSCKAVTEIVRSTALKRNAVMHHRLDGVGFHSACELFLLGLLTRNCGDRESFTVKVLIALEHIEGFLSCLCLALVHGVSLLPQELRGTQERTGCLFPSYNVTPLIIKLRKVTVRMNYIFIVIAEKCFRGRTNYKALSELILSTHGNYCALGSKACNVILFLLQKALRDKHRHINVLVTELLEARVKIVLNVLPDSVAVRTDDHTALNAGIVNKLRFLYYVCVPLSKINVHCRDLLYHFFIVCHFSLSFQKDKHN